MREAQESADSYFAGRITVGSDDQEIDPTTQPILPLDPATAIHDTLEKRVQQELGTSLLVLEVASDPIR